MKFEKFVENTVIQLETAIEHYEQSDNHYEYVLDVLKDALSCIREFKTKDIIESIVDHERRIAALEQDKKMRDTRDKVMGLFANMQYGKLCTDPERTRYYKLKLNEIFGSGAYQDTDKPFAPNPITRENSSVRKCCPDEIFGADGYKATSTPDESWHEDTRRRGENI